MDVDIALRTADCDRGNGPKSVALDVLAAEVRRLRERADAVRAELARAEEFTCRGGIPLASLIGLTLAVVVLDGPSTPPGATEGDA